YWEKPCASWGNTQTWNSFFYGRNQNATKQMSHDALGKELDLLIKYLKPETKEIQKAYAIQKELRNPLKRKKYEEKENLLPPPKKQQSPIILFCLIKGDVSARAFP
ncbi:17541_t:CDS:2, partial [Funneliformis caledonium]